MSKRDSKSTTSKLHDALNVGNEEQQPEEELDNNAADEVGGVLDHPNYKALEEQLTKAEEKSNDYWNKLLSTQAELENLHKRSERDVANAHKYAIEKFALELLAVVDSLEKGMEFEAQAADNELAKNICEGVALTHDMFLNVLAKHGLEPVNPVGEAFNPEFHEAMTMQEDPKAKSNTVLQVLQKGYLLNGRIVRPALVIVAK